MIDKSPNLRQKINYSFKEKGLCKWSVPFNLHTFLVPNLWSLTKTSRIYAFKCSSGLFGLLIGVGKTQSNPPKLPKPIGLDWFILFFIGLGFWVKKAGQVGLIHGLTHET